MKILVKTIFLFIFSAQLLAQSGVQFTTPIVVANGSTYGYTRPKIALDANNNPVILWGNSSADVIYVSTFNGTSFNTPQQINPVGTQPFITSWYNADIKSAGDTVVVVFPNTPAGTGVFLLKSIDGGNTWTDTIRVDNINVDGIAYFPSVAINELGNIAVTFMKHDNGWENPRYVLTTSFNGGFSFLPDTNASAVGTGDVCDCCPAHIIYENNKQVLIFRNNNSNIREFYAAVSNDNGGSFNGLNIDNQGWNYPSCPSSGPSAFLSGASLITVFMSGANGANRIYLSTSNINTLQLGNVKMIDSIVPMGTNQNHPKIAGKDSIMAMVWGNSIPGEGDIYFRYSNTGSMGLIGDGLVISNPTTGTQQNPDMVYANGVFHIVYQNTSTQELYYLKAILDEYVSLENNDYPILNKLTLNNGMLEITLNNIDIMGNKVELYDASGRNLLTTYVKNAAKLELDISSFPHGIYWIKMEGINHVFKIFK